LGQRSSNGQKYAIVCPAVTYLWCHLQTAQYWAQKQPTDQPINSMDWGSSAL